MISEHIWAFYSQSSTILLIRLFIRLLGLLFLLLGIYFLGQNIVFTNNISPYWWRGVAADASILFLTAAVLMFFILPRRNKDYAFTTIAVGIIAIFLSSRAILQPTSLWQFIVSLASLVGGY